MLASYFNSLSQKSVESTAPVLSGKVSRVRGSLVETRGFTARIGTQVAIETALEEVRAEVIGFADDTLTVMPLYPVNAISSGAKVRLIDTNLNLPSGDVLLGRVVDGQGQPLDETPIPASGESLSLDKKTTNPLHRLPIQQTLDVGVRAVNAALTLGCGQRVGLFAGSGVGKSILLGMMTRHTEADVVIVALVGERGREVREFVENILEKNTRHNFIVVAATADSTPLMRVKAAWYASQLASDFRSKGKKVLLLFDSLTRFAQAQRELALAVGEPPAARGYPASVFVQLPQLIELAGNGGDGKGSVTGIYSVLTEGDDLNDPVAESARAILDGHIVLSRKLAEEGIYPAIDLTASISRVMHQITSLTHQDAAKQVKQWIARYESIEDMLRLGAYQQGQDTETDMAVNKHGAIQSFIGQPMDQCCNFVESVDQMVALTTVHKLGEQAIGDNPLTLNSPTPSNTQGEIASVQEAFHDGVTSHSSIVDQR